MLAFRYAASSALKQARHRSALNRCIGNRFYHEYKAPVSDIRYLLNDVHDYQNHLAGLKNTPGREYADAETVDMIIETTASFT